MFETIWLILIIQFFKSITTSIIIIKTLYLSHVFISFFFSDIREKDIYITYIFFAILIFAETEYPFDPFINYSYIVCIVLTIVNTYDLGRYKYIIWLHSKLKYWRIVLGTLDNAMLLSLVWFLYLILVISPL